MVDLPGVMTGCLHADGLRGWPSWLAPTNSEVAETKIGTNQPDFDWIA